MTRIGIIGDYRATNPTHMATDEALQHSAAFLGLEIVSEWVVPDPKQDYSVWDGFLASPGSPYSSLEGALQGIRYAREADRPLLGTCGGFQHIVLEYARNVLNITDAAHEEIDPYASVLFLKRLECSLVGRTFEVRFTPDSVVGRAYGAEAAEEQYYCNFAVNPEYRKALTDGGLVVSGTDQGGEIRTVELPDRRFFAGTLFVPQARSKSGHPHPLLTAFCRAAAGV